MIYKHSIHLLAGSLLCSSCLTSAPTSSFDGLYSTTTGVRFGPGYGAGSYRGYPDDKVLTFRRPDTNCPEQVTVAPPGARENIFGSLPNPPGIVGTGSSLGIDEAEIPNQEWQQFQLAQESQGVATAALVPRPDALPVPDYYTNPAYHYLPVVGISHEQAQAFCQWRSQVVTNTLNLHLHHPDPGHADYIRCTYRLPTEAEWELAAATPNSQPCPTWLVQVNPKAAAYLKTRSGSQRDVATIQTDIEVYNQHNPSHSIINYRLTEPYFLRLQMPVWVYQGPATATGLFQLLGNVAELVQEPGLTKGGSYLDPLEACTAKAQGRYVGPAPSVGFRCVCEVSFPNQK